MIKEGFSFLDWYLVFIEMYGFEIYNEELNRNSIEKLKDLYNNDGEIINRDEDNKDVFLSDLKVG